MEKMIADMLKEGKNDTEIASAILGSEHSKGLKASDIAKEIARVKGLADVQAELKKLSDEKKALEAEATAKLEINAKVEKAVEESLKKVGIEDMAKQFNTGAFRTKGSLQRFDVLTGKMVDDVKVDEKYESANQMIRCLIAGDNVSAKSISNQIDLDNAKEKAMSRGEKITPTVSDIAGQGGYAIPAGVNGTIMQMTYAQSKVYQASNKNAIMLNSMLYPVLSGIAVNDIADQSTASTEAVASFANPTVSMKPAGAFSAISNKIIAQKGADLMNAFAVAYSSALARFLDLRLVVGCITNNGDLVDGIIFDANCAIDTDVAKGAFAFSDMTAMASAINQECDPNSLKWLCNRSVLDYIGAFETSAGDLLFPQYASGGAMRPLGYDLIVDAQIPNVLDVGADKRTTGTDSAIVLVDMSKFVVGLDDNFRIATSEHFYFTTDLTAIKLNTAYGCKVLVSNTARGRGITGF